MRRSRMVAIAVLVVALAGIPLAVGVVVGALGTPKDDRGSAMAAAGAARGGKKVQMAYAQWVTQHDANGGDRNVVIPLGYWKALSSGFTKANGMATLNLIDGTLAVVAYGLPADAQWDVWLVDNQPGPRRSVRPEPTDTMIKAGRLVRDGDTATLDAKLGAASFLEFHVDLVVVARAGGDPGTAAMLSGAPSLFQRLYTARRSERLLHASDFASHAGLEHAVAKFREAITGSGLTLRIDRILIDRGLGHLAAARADIVH